MMINKCKMKHIFFLFLSVFLHESCQSQTDGTKKNVLKPIYRYAENRFILLDTFSGKTDTILNYESWGVDDVIDVSIYNDNCILIYRNNDFIAFVSFEKKNGQWKSVMGRELLTIFRHTGRHDFKIIDENHIRVKEQETSKVKTYELDYVKKQVSFTETTDR